MSKVLKTLKGLNPSHMDNIIPEEHDILIVGERKKGEDGDSKTIKFPWTTKPSADALEAKVRKNKYLRCFFRRAGAVVTSATEGHEDEEVFAGDKRPQAGNIFKNDQKELYIFLLKKLEKGKYEEVDETEDGLPIVRIKAKTMGSVVSMTTPRYVPHSRKGGVKKALKATKYDHKTDSYKKGVEVVMMHTQFFADHSDCQNIWPLAVKVYESQVEPYLEEEVTIKKKKGNKKSKEKLSSKLANDEPGNEDTTED